MGVRVMNATLILVISDARNFGSRSHHRYASLSSGLDIVRKASVRLSNQFGKLLPLDVHLRKGQQLEPETRSRRSLAAWFSNLENRFLPKLDCQLDQMML